MKSIVNLKFGKTCRIILCSGQLMFLSSLVFNKYLPDFTRGFLDGFSITLIITALIYFILKKENPFGIGGKV